MPARLSKEEQLFADEVDALQIARTDAHILFGHSALKIHRSAHDSPEWWENAAEYVTRGKRRAKSEALLDWYGGVFESVYSLTCIGKVALRYISTLEATAGSDVSGRVEEETGGYRITEDGLEALVGTFRERFHTVDNGESKEYLKKVVGEVEVMVKVLEDMRLL
ncbi:hypothetical protein ACMFMG_006221 [Clarireedia jacksonii]